MGRLSLPSEPVRTCVGCRGEAGKKALIRLVRRPEGGAALDPTGRAPGRGAYLHADAACLDLARKRKTLERALRTTIQPDTWAKLLG
ncbi:MAG: YlxR family protein [Chloroflexi bacterium]|nr:MAG: YlxR family protein [Chloroflexota bacterium]